jgi:hypothetical protein
MKHLKILVIYTFMISLTVTFERTLKEKAHSKSATIATSATRRSLLKRLRNGSAPQSISSNTSIEAKIYGDKNLSSVCNQQPDQWYSNNILWTEWSDNAASSRKDSWIKGIVFEGDIICKNKKFNFLASVPNTSKCYIPWRTITSDIYYSRFADCTNDSDASAFLPSTKVNYLKLNMNKSNISYDNAILLIKMWNIDRNNRRKTISDDLQRMATHATTYTLNYALAADVKAGKTVQIDAAITATQKNIADLQSTIDAASDTSTEKIKLQSQKATADAKKEDAIKLNADDFKTIQTYNSTILQNEASIDDFTKSGADFTTQVSTHTSTQATELTNLQNYVSSLSAQMPDQATLYAKALENLKAGKFDDCNKILNSLLPSS